MSYKTLFKEENEESMEKFELAMDRIQNIVAEKSVPEIYQDFFKTTALFLIDAADLLKLSENDEMRNMSLDELSMLNQKMYADVNSSVYKESYANPSYMEDLFGTTYGKYLCYLYMRMRGIFSYAVTYKVTEFTILTELFIEIYNIFESEDLNEKLVYESIYWFESDYSDVFMEERIAEMFDLNLDFYKNIVMESDLSDLRYLYFYGLPVSKNEIETAKYLNTMTEDEIADIARTFTEGFKKGFIMGRKDMSIKDRVEIRYPLGFERVVKAAVSQFEAMNLKTIIRSNAISYTVENKQLVFDHKFDLGLYFNKAILDRKLSVARVVFEKYKKEAALKAGPAVIETFGENPFEPATNKGCIKLDDKQRKLNASYDNSYIQMFYEYQKGDETSFTIIAYPLPEIGDSYKDIFHDTMKINNLDSDKFMKIQQNIIDALDTSDYVVVKGKDGNRTDMVVAVHELKDPTKETLFENCVADVNIPVGEVFTSPKLTGTHGTLNVSEVFLNDLKFSNLSIDFEDGMVKNYSCDNFEDKELSKNFVRENLLQNRDTLPIGEFAIGTNTTAYVIAGKYDIVYKLPILIVEKMGPHFAIGDTCYSFEEDSMTFNPDGKAIIARENEKSALRKTDIENAYFGIHTDITIPYDEIGEISAVKTNGEKITIIKDGRFVLEGTKELNIPFETKNN